ncbi:hypothetical protein LSTR_LSTR012844 [Laodelphax striatellus]|uniref:Uncharacterized protein n=1 Tax=Laodelphax striatellus TaxID=195883 RepID=A0A482XQU6_LAOST|nr:hypothetical protein LSTR_LSTR012844 [Laodelphax striatellus]
MLFLKEVVPITTEQQQGWSYTRSNKELPTTGSRRLDGSQVCTEVVGEPDHSSNSSVQNLPVQELRKTWEACFPDQSWETSAEVACLMGDAVQCSSF